jgi:hypothetical protein
LLVAPTHQHNYKSEKIMSKQIMPHELAAIVRTLLIKPSLLGALEDAEAHQAFFGEIAQVIADHCGGEIASQSEPDTYENYLSNQFSSPYVGIAPNAELPSLYNNVWAAFDIEEMDDVANDIKVAKELGIDLGEPMTAMKSQKLREVMKGLMVNNLTCSSLTEYTSEINLEMVDWCSSEGDIPDADKGNYKVKYNIGNQAAVELVDESNEPVFGFMFEINNGVPALHIDLDGGDAVLHIHKAHDGLILTPNSINDRFSTAPCDRYSYNDPSSLLIS